SRFFAASLFGAGGALTAATFVVSGGLSDRLGRHSTYLVGSACLGAAILVLLRVSSVADLGWLYAYTVLEALGEGARSSLVTAIASDTFPGEHMGAINGSVGAAYGAGAAVSTWLAGALYDSTGSYAVALWTAVAAVLVSAVCIHLIGRYPPRLPELIRVVKADVKSVD
ncbi:MAG: MFS transporter, partial [Candidatus Promineofilum sp.]|nr:MFS transporter [Promineifilum sp.]